MKNVTLAGEFAYKTGEKDEKDQEIVKRTIVHREAALPDNVPLAVGLQLRFLSNEVNKTLDGAVKAITIDLESDSVSVWLEPLVEAVSR